MKKLSGPRDNERRSLDTCSFPALFYFIKKQSLVSSKNKKKLNWPPRTFSLSLWTTRNCLQHFTEKPARLFPFLFFCILLEGEGVSLSFVVSVVSLGLFRLLGIKALHEYEVGMDAWNCFNQRVCLMNRWLIERFSFSTTRSFFTSYVLTRFLFSV